VEELLAILTRFTTAKGGISVDTPLLSSGIVDSFHLVQLLVELEAVYAIQIDLAEVGVDNFNTPEQILSFLKGKR
jgi:acyl carrier protein